MPLYLGVDPGASGGLAVLNQEFSVRSCPGCPVYLGQKLAMPPFDKDVMDFLTPDDIDDPLPKFSFAVLEKVSGFVGQGQPGSAMFKFGASYGALRMALTAAKIPFEEVTPQRWQKGLGIASRKKTESKTQWKNRLKAFAERLFPDAKITLAVADAILIAEFGRRLREGLLK